MLGNCEKMVLISSTTNEWPQHQIDEKNMMASTGRVMEKPAGAQEQQQQQQQQQQQAALKCPRCDSSNTKFCYYNNYSLSQPRHFCKACKRYWTRGGTLRNVPVGGGCRKNKRVKRPSSSSSSSSFDASASSSAPAAGATNPHGGPPQIDISSTSNHIKSLFYGLPSNPSDINLQFPRFNSRVSNVDSVSGYDLNPQLSALGLGFSSGIMTNDDGDYRNGFNPSKQIQDIVTSNPLLSSYSSMFGPSSSTSTSPIMASLIASTLQQQKYINGGHRESRVNHFQTLVPPFEDMQIAGNSEGGIGNKEVKMEEGQNRMEWNNVPYQSHMEQIGSSDPSLYWNLPSNTLSAWPDLANIGSSSVTSLI